MPARVQNSALSERKAWRMVLNEFAGLQVSRYVTFVTIGARGAGPQEIRMPGQGSRMPGQGLGPPRAARQRAPGAEPQPRAAHATHHMLCVAAAAARIVHAHGLHHAPLDTLALRTAWAKPLRYPAAIFHVLLTHRAARRRKNFQHIDAMRFALWTT